MSAMSREAKKPSSKRRSGLFVKFGLFIFVSQLPLCFVLFSSQNTLTPPVEVEVNTMALVMNDVDAAPKRIVVLGDHLSGIKSITDALKKAFGDNVAMMHESPHRSDILEQTELDKIVEKKDILWIMAARSPCDWAGELIEARRRKCAEMNSVSEQCSAESTKDYYDIEWQEESQDNIDEWIIPSTRTPHVIKHPELFSMRFTKLFIMKQIMEANPRHVKVVQFNEFEMDPNVLVKDLEKEYLFHRADSSAVYPISTNPRQITCMGPEEWEIAQQRIDWTIEGYFGFNRFDCHLCRENFNPGSKLSNIFLLGERNSGTTFVSNTLAEAFHRPNHFGDKNEHFNSKIPVLLYKHMFRHDLLNATELAEIERRDDILWIMAVRSPCDWAEAMFRKPYHLCSQKHPERCGPDTNPVWMNHNNLKGNELVDFFTTVKWIDWAESTHFMREHATDLDRVHRIDPYSISKPSANYTYPNVWALRKHKLQIMRQMIDVAPRNVKFVRLNEFERGPALFIDNIVKEFDMTVKAEYMKPPPSSYSHTTTCLTKEEWKAAQNFIDWEIEAYFGFSPHDCRMCYGYNQSSRLFDRVKKQRERGKNIQPGRFRGGKAGKKENNGLKQD